MTGADLALFSGLLVALFVLPVARPALLRARARAELQGGRLVVGRLARPVAPGGRPRLPARGQRGRRPLHHRLPDRALAVARQPVRLPPAVRLLRRPLRAPSAAALLGDRRRARDARRLHPRRQRADRAVPRRHLPARRRPDRARLPDLARGLRERRPGQEPDGSRRAQGVPGHGRVPRGPLVRQAGRPALRHAAVPVPGGDRLRRHRVRGRLDPGGVRDHARPADHLDGQRVRAARDARAVRARGEPRGALPLPRRDDRDRARPRGREAADRGPRVRRARREPRGHRRRRSRSASCSRFAPTGATRARTRSARSASSR